MTDTTTTAPATMPLPGLPPAPLATLPEQIGDVTAGRLARWLSVVLTQRGALHFTSLDRQNPLAYRHSIDALMAEWALCHLLREIPGELADRLSKDIWTAWQAGDELYELPPEWMTEYGMDPNPVIEQVREARQGKPADPVVEQVNAFQCNRDGKQVTA